MHADADLSYDDLIFLGACAIYSGLKVGPSKERRTSAINEAEKMWDEVVNRKEYKK